MKTIQGKNGGVLYAREKGDPSPNKGKKRASTASLIAVLTREKRTQITKAQEFTILRLLLDMPLQEVYEKYANSKSLPAGVVLEVRGWFDKRNGFDNLRKSKEKVFGKPTEHIDTTTNGASITNPIMNMPFEDIKRLYDDIQQRKKQTAKKTTKKSNVESR